ncbi:hypothetical protein BH23PLA1_BH23PLA1_18860 [soil metagenome]
MNPVESLKRDLTERFPHIAAEIDAPADEAGTWHLDIRPGGEAPWIVVEWRSGLGFGVSTPGADDYGVKPDELYPNARAAFERVVLLLDSGQRTQACRVGTAHHHDA